MNPNNYIAPVFRRQLVSKSDFTLLDPDSIQYDDIIEGNGFFVGNYFVTASHILTVDNNNYPFIKWKNQTIFLKKEDALIWLEIPTDSDGISSGHINKENGDIAIFKVDGVNSPLILADSMPAYGQTLQCNFYHRKQFGQPIGKNLYYWATKGIILGEDGFCGNFFTATMNPAHPEGGSSGSPIFDGNIIYGILHGGNTKEICAFFAAKTATELLHQNI